VSGSYYRTGEGLTRRWLSSCEGPYPAQVFDTADTVHDRFEEAAEDSVIEWPLMCDSGEMAAMMNMVSCHEAEFDFDHTKFPTLQYWTNTYNTRKLSKSRKVTARWTRISRADDVDLEFDLTLRRIDPLQAKPEVEPPTVYASNPPSEWEVEGLSDEVSIESAMRVIKEARQHGLTKAELSVSWTRIRIDWNRC